MLRLVRLLKHVLLDIAGMLTSPRRTLARISGGDGQSPLWPVLLFVGVVALGRAKELVRFSYLIEHGAETMLRRTREILEQDLRTDAIVLVVTCVALAVLARLVAADRVRAWDAANAGAWLLVPVAALKAFGVTLDAFGLDVWFMPHFAVDSQVVIVRGDVDWGRFALKCAITYAWPLALALMMALSFRRAHVTADGVSQARARVGVALAGVLAVSAVGATVYDVVQHADRIRPLLPGDPLPDVALRELTTKGVGKKKIAVQSFRGKVLVLDFWASWCNPCRRSMPELDAIAAELGDRGLVVLGVNREPQDPDAAAAALEKIGVRFASVIDDRFYGERLGLTTLPSSYIVDREGKVRHFHMGYAEPDVVRREIEALLAEP